MELMGLMPPLMDLVNVRSTVLYLRNCSKKISPIAIELPVVLNGMKLIQWRLWFSRHETPRPHSVLVEKKVKLHRNLIRLYKKSDNDTHDLP